MEIQVSDAALERQISPVPQVWLSRTLSAPLYHGQESVDLKKEIRPTENRPNRTRDCG